MKQYNSQKIIDFLENEIGPDELREVLVCSYMRMAEPIIDNPDTITVDDTKMLYYLRSLIGVLKTN